MFVFLKLEGLNVGKHLMNSCLLIKMFENLPYYTNIQPIVIIIKIQKIVSVLV